jgi:hypothetical protein
MTFSYGPNTWYTNSIKSRGITCLISWQHTQPIDSFCTVWPDTVHFTCLRKTRLPRSMTLSPTPTDPEDIPVVSDPIRLHRRTGFSDAAGAKRLAPSALPYQRSIVRQYSTSNLESDDESDGEDAYCINQLLGDLHARYPAFDFPQYEKQLRTQGVHYLVAASMFNVDFYISEVGMVEGAARLFYQWVAKEYRKVQRVRQGNRRQKRERVVVDGHEENVPL